MATTRREDKTVSLTERLAELFIWFVAVGREFWVRRVLRRPDHYVGRRRKSNTVGAATYREDEHTGSLIVKVKTRSWREPASLLRSHLGRITRRASKEAAIVYTGRVSAGSVALIATMTIFMRQNELFQQAMHPGGGAC
jgi:hypothetical protein